MDGSLKRSLSSNSMPSLISRLDHLDSSINYLEDRKCSSARWASDRAVALRVVNRECVPLDLAVKEAQSKGSLLDRITSLEDRLIQLCLDIESEGASPTKKCEKEQKAASPRTSTKGISNSFSRFRPLYRSHNHKQPMSPLCMDKFPIAEQKEQNAKLEPSNEASFRGMTRKTKNEKASPKTKKLVTSSLLHLRLMGC